MMGLSDGRKSFQIRLVVLIQYGCDRQPATHPASHVAVAITLNAKASSLKTEEKMLHFLVLQIHQQVTVYYSPLL